MKFCVQLNPQVSIDKPGASLLPTLVEQVRVADEAGFDAFSMGDHTNIPGLQRLNQVLHDFLMMFAPKATQPEIDTAIDWEDGEIDDQTEPPGR